MVEVKAVEVAPATGRDRTAVPAFDRPAAVVEFSAVPTVVELNAAAFPPNSETVHVEVPWAKLIICPTTYSPPSTEVEAKVMGTTFEPAQPPWNWLIEAAPAVVEVPVDHALELLKVSKVLREVALAKE